MIKYTWTGIELDTISHYADLGLIAGQAYMGVFVN